MNPNDTDAYYNRGNAYLEKRERMTVPIGDFSKAIELNPKLCQMPITIAAMFLTAAKGA